MKLVIKDNEAEARPRWGDLVGCVVVDRTSAYLVCGQIGTVQLVGVGTEIYIAHRKDKKEPCPNHYKIYRNVTITAEKD